MSSAREGTEHQASDTSKNAAQGATAEASQPGRSEAATGSPFGPLLWLGVVFLGVLLFGIFAN